MRARLDLKAFKSAIAKRLTPSASKMEAIANVALAQVKRRFATGGQSGGVAWAPTKTSGADNPPLSGFADTFHVSATAGKGTVESNAPFITVHQRGATIKPKTAKRLFIPLTAKAREAIAAHAKATPKVQRIYPGVATIEKAEPSGEKLKYGVDYVYSRGPVAVPARPMLPTSDAERAEHAKATAKILAHGAPTTQLTGTDVDLADIFGIEIEGTA